MHHGTGENLVEGWEPSLQPVVYSVSGVSVDVSKPLRLPNRAGDEVWESLGRVSLVNLASNSPDEKRGALFLPLPF